MRSELCQWLINLQVLASKDNVIVEAQHYDCLEYLHRMHGKDLEAAYKEYTDFKKRYEALTDTATPVPAKEIVMYAAFDVQKIFKEDNLTKDWLPSSLYQVKDAPGRHYYKRPDMLKVFEAWYLDKHITPRCETVKTTTANLIEVF